MTIIKGTINIPTEQYFDFIDQHNPAATYKGKTYYGVPRPAEGGEFILVDFVVDSEQDAAKQSLEPACLTQWREVKHLFGEEDA